MDDVADRISAWLENDEADGADQTLRDARAEIIGLRARLATKDTFSAEDVAKWRESMNEWEKETANSEEISRKSADDLRDTFAAAALTGWAGKLRPGSVFDLSMTAKQAYEVADAMLRERVVAENATVGVPGVESGAGCTPVAQDQTFDSSHTTYQQRFNAAVMNWISEATSAIQIAENYRPILADACLACWDAYGNDSTNHDAAPAATAVSDEDRTDKAATSHRRDRPGDTPSAAEIDALEFVVVSGHTASVYDCGLLRQWLIRLRPEFGRPGPINDGHESHEKNDENRVFYDMKSTPVSHGTPGNGTSQSECRFLDSRNAKDPVAWGIECDGELLAAYTCEDEESAVAMVERFAESGMTGHVVVPLYRSPALTGAEREAIDEAAIWYGGVDGDERCQRVAGVLRGLLERLK